MLRNLISIVVSILLVSAAGTSQAGDVRSFDIMGMKLGMSVAEIEAAAVAEGLLEKGRMKAPSFEQEVLIAKNQTVEARSYKGLQKLKLESATGRVEVDFVATQDGPRAHMIFYVVTDPNLTSDEVSKQLTVKYGEPAKQTDQDLIWGDAAVVPLRTAPSLEFSPEPMVSAFGKKPVGALTLRDPQLPKQSVAEIADAAS